MRSRLAVPRRALAVAAGAVVVLAIGFLWIRDSSIVEVDRVTVTGASGPDAGKVRSALSDAAKDMTTLNVRMEKLEAAVDPYPIVEGLAVRRDLPDGLTVEVRQRRTVAVVVVGEREVPVSADGRILNGATPEEQLPVLALERIPATHVEDDKGRNLVEVAAGAPEALLRRARRVFIGDHGVTVEMEEGPELYFGSGDAADAKWIAAARVLADPSAEGAQYVDVREPHRPAAGGLNPLTAAEPESETPEEPVTTPDPTVATTGL